MIIVRRFEPKDAEAVSEVIRVTMRKSNRSDYSMEILQPLIDYFSPEKVLQLCRERDCLVAESDNQIVGTAALDKNELAAFFVLPDFQNKGIGSSLLKQIEQIARQKQISTIIVESSITGEPFYEKMGYCRNGSIKEGTAGKQIGMEKRLF
jgi:N-acetylglutamate synthase-like GNAT family acetyltransferase